MPHGSLLRRTVSLAAAAAAGVFQTGGSELLPMAAAGSRTRLAELLPAEILTPEFSC